LTLDEDRRGLESTGDGDGDGNDGQVV